MSTLLILALVLVVIIFYPITIYNKLIKLKNLVQEAWSGIDVFLKKRYDLIPNLIETVKGYASHEKETLQNVISARNQALQATSVDEKQRAENGFSRALGGIFALAEQYPDLKANTQFLELQQQLNKLETEIEQARRYYNGTTRNFNTATETFPSNIVASIFKFAKFSFFEVANAEERDTPQVKF